MPPDLCRTQSVTPPLLSTTYLLRSFLVEGRVFSEPWAISFDLLSRTVDLALERVALDQEQVKEGAKHICALAASMGIRIAKEGQVSECRVAESTRWSKSGRIGIGT